MTSNAQAVASSTWPAGIAGARREMWTAGWFLLPAGLTGAVFLAGPIIGLVFLAFSNWSFDVASLRFVGFDNFLELFRDPVFWTALGNTVVYVVVVVPVTMMLGLAIALATQGTGRASGFYRAVHFLPSMATMAALAISWEVMLHPTIGLVNRVLADFGVAGPNWLRDPATVMGVICVVGIWENLGIVVVLFIAGLSTIPRDLYDAAEIDGADGAWDRLVTVTWPLMGPVALFVFVVMSVRAFKVFDTVAVLTHGEPNHASEVVIHAIYSEGVLYLRTGYASALTVVFLLIVLALALLQTYLLDKRTHYG